VASRRLLLLFPRAWRDRYGEEFLALLGEGSLSASEWIDVLRGAVDAWLSADVRDGLAVRRVATSGGRSMRLKSMMACERRSVRVSIFDSLLGAGVMVGASFVLFLLARRLGWPDGGKALAGLSFPLALTLSLPFWLTKGVPWKAQAAIIGGTITLLAAITCVSAVG
jgi:hypothetical protein